MPAGSTHFSGFDPSVGLGGVLVGLYMRANFPGISSDQVLPQFILGYLPRFGRRGPGCPADYGHRHLAGIVLGISTILTRDIYKQYIRPGVEDSGMLLMQRLIILLVCLLSVPVITTSAGTLIMGWVTLSMFLQGCTVLLPLLAALFLPRLVTPAAATLSALLGPLAVVAWYVLFPDGLSPVYPGFLVSLLTIILVSLVDRRSPGARSRLTDTTK